MFSYISGLHLALTIFIDLSQGRESFLSKAKLLLVAPSSSASTVASTTTAPTISSTTGRSISLLSWWTIAFLSLSAFTIWSLATLTIFPSFSTTPRILVSEGKVDVQLFLSVGPL